jgi:hypothetical protein
MRDRLEPSESPRVVAARRVGQRRSSAPAPDSSENLAIPSVNLHPSDRRTWEEFWTSLLGEYDRLGGELADAA